MFENFVTLFNRADNRVCCQLRACVAVARRYIEDMEVDETEEPPESEMPGQHRYIQKPCVHSTAAYSAAEGSASHPIFTWG